MRNAVAHSRTTALNTVARTKTRRDCSLVLILGPGDHIPLVRNVRHSRPAWKIVGGVSGSSKSHQEGALELVKQETGLTIPHIRLLQHMSDGKRIFRIYGTYTESFEGLQQNEKTAYQGELLSVRLFAIDDILSGRVEILDFHRKVIVNVATLLHHKKEI